MRNHVRTNKEINPAIMPDGWSIGKGCTCFTLHISMKDREAFMEKFAIYRSRVYKSEVIGYLVSNYIAFHLDKDYDSFAMKVLSFGKLYIKSSHEYVDYSIGSIALTFHKVVRKSLKQLPIKTANALLYYAVSAFYNAPDSILDKLCYTIEQLKNPIVKIEKHLLLQTELPDSSFNLIKSYAYDNGMTICELMCVVLRTVCMSKRERAEDCSPIARLFNLYRIITQPGEPFINSNGAILTVQVCGEREKKYMLKFIKRRGLTRKELLRKAIRALVYVLSHKSRFEKRIQYHYEVVADEEDYYYERLSKMDFTRNVYAYK